MPSVANSIKKKINYDLLSKVGYSVLIGVLGTILLTLFLYSFLGIFLIPKLIPWIIGFNTAMTGYSLLDKTRDQLRHKQVYCIGAGILNVIITCLILSLISTYIFGEHLFGKWSFALFLIISIVCSELGALLAIKYFKLRKS